MFCFVLIIVVGLLNACGAAGTSEQSTKRISEADNGRAIELRVGDKLEVTLPGNPTTGFQWEVSDVDSLILTPIGDPEFEPSSNAVGSGGSITFRFEAIGTGQTNLKLIHHRPFVGDVPPTQTYEVTVIVR